MKQIQLFKPIFDKEEILSQISECLDKSWTGLGFKTIEFEERFKEYTKVENAHFLNSATSGLHLALEICKKKRDQAYSHVLTTPLTFIADSHAIIHARLYPTFVDIDDYLCMSPVKLERMLTWNPNIMAVIYVGMGGNTGELTRISSICKSFSTPLILDAAHMMGTKYCGRHIGTEADFTVFSFQSVKNLPTADSGMLVCRDSSDDKLARKLSWLGISKDTWDRQTKGGNWDYNVEYVGWKYHGNSIMAAMALSEINHLDSGNRIRHEQAGRYLTRLDPKKYVMIPNAPECIPSKHLFQVRVHALMRDDVIQYAASKGVQLGVHYKCHTEYRMYSDQRGFVPKAEQISRELISLPIGPHLTEEDINFIIEVMNGYKA